MRADAFRSVLVVCTRQIGDVLLTTPLIDAAKARWPEARVDVLGFAGTLGMLRGNPTIGELIEVPPGSGWMQSISLIRRLWRRYDLALIAQYSDRAHLYGTVAARHRSGHLVSVRSTSWWKRLLLDHAVVVDTLGTHAVLEKLALLAPWAELPPQVRVQAPPGHALPGAFAAQLQPQRRCVVLHVPSLVRYKQWPLPRWIELMRGLLDDGFQIVLSGGPAAADRERTATVAAAFPAALASAQVLDAAGVLDLNQMVRLLEHAALYIGPDTSITHLAAACGTPLIALYGPIDPRFWGPWPQGHAPTQPYVSHGAEQHPCAASAEAPGRGTLVLMQGAPFCVPCNQAGCERRNDSRSACLEALPAQRVLGQARALLGLPAAGMRRIPVVPTRAQAR